MYHDFGLLFFDRGAFGILGLTWLIFIEILELILSLGSLWRLDRLLLPLTRIWRLVILWLALGVGHFVASPGFQLANLLLMHHGLYFDLLEGHWCLLLNKLVGLFYFLRH